MSSTNHRIFGNSVAMAVWVVESGRPGHSWRLDVGACVYIAAGWTKRTIRCSFAFGSDYCSWCWGNLGSVSFVMLLLLLLCLLAMLHCLWADPCPIYRIAFKCIETYFIIVYGVCIFVYFVLSSAMARKKHSKVKQFKYSERLITKCYLQLNHII